MARQDDAFLRELLAVFKVEAEEHIREISTGLLKLEKEPAGKTSPETLEIIYRGAHSLKGAARAVELTSIEQICQSAENVFSKWKKKEIRITPDQFDALYAAVDSVNALLSPDTAGSVDVAATRKRIDDLLTRPVAESAPDVKTVPTAEENAVPEAEPLKTVSPHLPDVSMVNKIIAASNKSTAKAAADTQPGSTADAKPVPGRDDSAKETVRIPVHKLDTLFMQAEEMLSFKHILAQRVNDISETLSAFDKFRKAFIQANSDIRRISQQLQASLPGQTMLGMDKVAGFFDAGIESLKEVNDRLSGHVRSAEDDHKTFGGRIENLLDDAKKVLLLPFNLLLNSLPRMVRDISKQQGKEVDLLMTGGDVEIDKRILEEMKDPLIHILRNCVDHGLESPQEREKRGKSPRGTINISISHLEGGTVEIIVSDDGKGIDSARVRDAAVRHGVIGAQDAERLSDKEALLLIFQSSVSTSPIITELSGRGLGLAIVREKVDKLGGRISVTTDVDRGTTLKLILPLNLATYRGILVRIAGYPYFIPIANVERTLRIKTSDIKTVESRECVQIGDEVMSLARMENILELKGKTGKPAQNVPVPVLVLASADTRIAFTVDEVLSEQEVIVKNLGRQLSRVRNVAGATVTGAGEVVPILNVSDLVRTAVRSEIAAPVSQESGDSRKEAASVLVAEDSITSRTLIKNILESNGYIVTTAVDGADAWTKLRTAIIDIVVSDIDMPRMNGFELAAKIRADSKISELPIVLVTARESREDRERGINVGANAYIVKSSFDQTVLLNVLKRFA